MKLQRVEPREGAAWVRRGLQVFMRQPLGFAALFAACLLVFVVMRSLPLVGSLLLLLVAPAGSLVFMIASRLVGEGHSPMPAAFTTIVRAGRPRLLELAKLGAAYLVAAFLVYMVSAAVDGGAFGDLVDSMRDGKASQEDTVARMSDGRMQFAVLFWLTMVGLLAVPFWHAPALVFWAAQGWAKALFFSTVAIWRNRGAFAMFGLVWTGLSVGFIMLSGVGVALLGPQFYAFVGTPLMLALATVFYASLWFSFAGCFAETGPPGAGSGPSTTPDDSIDLSQENRP